MAAADLGEIASFPFVEAPDSAQITDGLRLLEELGALQAAKTRRIQRPRTSRRPSLLAMTTGADPSGVHG